MSEELDEQSTLEAALVQRLLECRPEDVLAKDAEPSDAALGTLERLCTETLGLMAASLEPIAPDAAVRASLMRRAVSEAAEAKRPAVRSVETPSAEIPSPEIPSPETPSPEPTVRGGDEISSFRILAPEHDQVAAGSNPRKLESPPAAEPDDEDEAVPASAGLSGPRTFLEIDPDLALHAEDEGAEAAPAAESGETMLRFDDSAPYDPTADRSLPPGPAYAAHRGGGHSRWPLALAATLAVLAGLLSAKLYLDVQRHESTIAELSSRATPPGERAAAVARANLQLVTAPGVEVCALKPVSESLDHRVRGRLYVAPDHQHWYLAIQGLEPNPDDQTYHLWFIVGDERISGGRFEVREGEVVEMSDDAMPEGSRAVAVSLEPREGIETEDGEMLLFGDEMVRLL